MPRSEASKKLVHCFPKNIFFFSFGKLILSLINSIVKDNTFSTMVMLEQNSHIGSLTPTSQQVIQMKPTPSISSLNITKITHSYIGLKIHLTPKIKYEVMDEDTLIH